MIKMIAAVSKNGVIGQNNDIPWRGKYPEDFKFFRQMTTGGEVIFGRKTFESIGKPLPKRNNIVITRQEKIDGVTCFQSLDSWVRSRAMILEDVTVTKWICGGARLYQEGMEHASEIYLTLIPETIKGEGLVHFPWIDLTLFRESECISIENTELKVLKYVRR
jgi:dihydrofolate reductase